MLGLISNRMSARIISHFGVSRRTLVKDMCIEGTFFWQTFINEELLVISRLESLIIIDSSDSLVWNNKVDFTIKRVWEDIRIRGN